jgi:hypothetical protein
MRPRDGRAYKQDGKKPVGRGDAAMWHAMSVFCLADSTARVHKKARFGNKGSRAIEAETPQGPSKRAQSAHRF